MDIQRKIRFCSVFILHFLIVLPAHSFEVEIPEMSIVNINPVAGFDLRYGSFIHWTDTNKVADQTYNGIKIEFEINSRSLELDSVIASVSQAQPVIPAEGHFSGVYSYSIGLRRYGTEGLVGASAGFSYWITGKIGENSDGSTKFHTLEGLPGLVRAETDLGVSGDEFNNTPLHITWYISELGSWIEAYPLGRGFANVVVEPNFNGMGALLTNSLLHTAGGPAIDLRIYGDDSDELMRQWEGGKISVTAFKHSDLQPYINLHYAQRSFPVEPPSLSKRKIFLPLLAAIMMSTL